MLLNYLGQNLIFHYLKRNNDEIKIVSISGISYIMNVY